ncbi:hypothetical protein LO762_02035 [Actinocorallia sp. API 0066]|uniref:DUF6640 family protein n=1 Tax=Actinocorallia sp. API 0066 TaxID=2896846 RepID=UPI001E320222|nr:DUF6640 family protein [Actinocorallia sp. API 0066]MCD0447980.1 hypothetical protein [Actinocorallia sp. API 0066]
MFTIARVLLTVAVLGFSLIPVLADFNRTHATNPLWTGHARYHVVWQVSSYAALGAVSLGLLWLPLDHAVWRAHLTAAIALCVYGGFFAAAATRRLYGGTLADPNGYQPIKLRVFGRARSADLNILAFTIFVLVLAIAWAILIGS